MKIVAEVPHQHYKITVFLWNGKYLIKYETPNFEQTYKLSEFDVTSEDDVKKLIEDKAFTDSVIEVFKSMSKGFSEVSQRIL